MFTDKNLQKRLLEIGKLKGKKVFTTSFGLEDQVLLHFIHQTKAEIEIATLDTGRLFQETYDVWANSESRYKLTIKAYTPPQVPLNDYLKKSGINGFYSNLEARKNCCFVRKILPLNQALEGFDYWLTGLRASQSNARQETPFQENERGLVKLNPLADFSRDELLEIAKQESIPLNALHDKGFPSIGCAPCTRAIEPHEDERAGRWWWENSAQECGLHVKENA